MMRFEKITAEEFKKLSQKEKNALADEFLGMLGKNEDEQAANFKKLKQNTLASIAGAEFSLAGFRAWFELMNGFTLHREGEVWAENIFISMTGLKKILQEAFRGSGKTTVLSKFFFAYYVGHHPWTTNMIVRVNTQKARETALEVATIIESDNRWGMVFPNVVPDTKRGWGAETGYYLKEIYSEDGDEDYSAWLEKCSDTGRPSGPTFIGYGFDSGSNQGSRTNGILLVDDIHDKNNTRSDKQLEDVKDYVKDILLPIPVPGEGLEAWNFTPWLINDAYSARVETGMYVHSKSPVFAEVPKEEALKNVNNPKSLKYGYIFWSRDWQLPEDIKNGNHHAYPFAEKYWRLSWPERWDHIEIARKFKDIGTIAFARMYMLDLKATQGLKLRNEWLHYFPHDQIDPSWSLVAGIDYASVVDRLKHKDRDYFTMAIGALIPGGGLVLIDGVRRHVTLGEALQIANQKCAEYAGRITAIGVESIGKGEEFYGQFRLADDIFGNPLPIYPITGHVISKGKRFEEYLGPRFQFSRIWVTTKENKFITHFKDEWLSYPNGEHDDCLDAVYMMAKMSDPHLAIKGDSKDKKDNDDANQIHPIARGFSRK